MAPAPAVSGIDVPCCVGVHRSRGLRERCRAVDSEKYDSISETARKNVSEESKFVPRIVLDCPAPVSSADIATQAWWLDIVEHRQNTVNLVQSQLQLLGEDGDSCRKDCREMY